MIKEQFLKLSKEAGIEEAQLQHSKSSALSFSIYHNEIDNYQIENDIKLKACGIYNGKFGSSFTQKQDIEGIEFLIEGIKDSAEYNESQETKHLYKGSESYCKKDVFNQHINDVTISEKIELCKQIEKDLLALDERIVEVDGVNYEQFENELSFENSFGVDLKQRSNGIILYACAIAKSGEETKTAYHFFFGSDISEFNKDVFVKELAEKVLSKLGGKPCKSGKYPTILEHSVFSNLINYYLSSTIAEEVQKGSSFFAGKLHEKIASELITIEERPLEENIFFKYFDDEGVAAYNKTIVEKGVLNTYLYNLETAGKDGVESTGNGKWAGNKMGTNFDNIFVKPGSITQKQLFSKAENGVFITSIQGLGTGMNPQSGNFSCQAQGFLIENGEITKPLNLITLSGNLFTMLEDVVDLDNNSKMHVNSVECPDILIKEMSIGGE